MAYPSAHELRYFLETCETLNLSRAAERLGLTQSALTHSIRRLEGALGAKLLDRGRAGVRLTRAGARFQPRARALLEQWERILDQARDEESGPQGSYVLGCHVSVALYSLAKFIPRLLGEHPRLSLRLAHDLSRKIVEDVVSGRVDVALAINAAPHPDLVIKPIAADKVTFWRSPNGATQTLMWDPGLAQSQSLVQAASKHQMFERTIATSSLEAIGELCAAGAGVGILPTRVAAKWTNLQIAWERAPSHVDALSVVCKTEFARDPGVRAIVDAIKRAGI